MKKTNCYIARLLHCLPVIVFCLLLTTYYLLLPSPVQAALLDPCTSSPECGADWLYCNNNGRCAPLNPVVYSDSSLKKFQTVVKKSEEKGETNLQWYMGSDNGTIESTTNALTGLIVGNDIDWDALAQGNFQNANIAGAYGFTSNLVAQILTIPPVSSREYFADLGRNFGLAKPAYAQGIGFSGLSKLLPLWKATRNLAYILFVIVFLATGLAIMFRVKLDPKTVVTIQNAIPKLIIALILVTFSYAIVGLLIDLIYLIIYLGVLALQGPLEAVGSSVPTTLTKFTSYSFGDGIKDIMGGFATILTDPLKSATVVAILGGVTAVLTGAVAVGVGIAVAALPILIFAVIALFLIIKLFFALLLCYISIIVSVIVAPLQIMLGALPGSTMGFSSWFKNLLANILVFPAVALVILIGQILIQTGGPDWTPPVMSTGGGALTALLGLAMLLLVNKVPDMVKAAFKMKPAGYGTAIGEALGAPKMLLGKAIGLGTTVASINKSYGEITGTQGTGLLARFRRPGRGGSVADNLPG